jgi:hypothetical protein
MLKMSGLQLWIDDTIYVWTLRHLKVSSLPASAVAKHSHDIGINDIEELVFNSGSEERCSLNVFCIECIVTYSSCSTRDGTSLHSKSQYTTVKHSRKLFEHTYASDLYGPGALIPIGFFQQDLLWRKFLCSL